MEVALEAAEVDDRRPVVLGVADREPPAGPEHHAAVPDLAPTLGVERGPVEDDLPLQRVPAEEPLREETFLDDGEGDVQRLLFLLKPMLDRLLARIAARREALASLTLELKLERAPGLVETLKPADLSVDVTPRLKTLKVSEPPKRGAGVKVPDVATLVSKLKNEAKVI